MSDRPSSMRLLMSQAGYQNKIFFRNPTAAFFTLLFPLMIFVVFTLVFGNEEIEELGVTMAQYFAPAMAVFAAVSASYTNIAVTTAYQRDEGILKRVRGTPLPAVVYLGGKILSAVMI
ncbi:MAG: ABC transporter permease, partial [Acidimicrobiia bacterium]